MYVLDASALLAHLFDEPGADALEDLFALALVSAVNWSEALQKAVQAGDDADEVGGLWRGAGVEIEPVWAEDAHLAAALWPTNRSLSLGDRLCLATAMRLEVVAVTADRRWADADCEADVLVIR